MADSLSQSEPLVPVAEVIGLIAGRVGFWTQGSADFS